MEYAQSLEDWAKDKPLSILQLDPADRAVLRIADERDTIQKKTFTKWVNMHLKKIGKRVADLFDDLQDGHNLLSLLEVLAGELLPRERGSMRFHMLQNVQTSLDFLKYKKIKLVNIRAEDIVDGNPKLILGLIWTIILHFQIADIIVGSDANVSARDALLRWAQKSSSKYPGVRVTDFTKSWGDGLAFNAIIHRNRPDLIDWNYIKKRSVKERLEYAFNIAENEIGVTRLIDPEDVDTPQPDEKSLITYISSLYDAFPHPPAEHPLYDTTSLKWQEYLEAAADLSNWIHFNLDLVNTKDFPSSFADLKKLEADMNRFRVDEIPAKARLKQRLATLSRELEKYTPDEPIGSELLFENLERNWQKLMLAYQGKDRAIHREVNRLQKLQRLSEKLRGEIRQVETFLEEMEQKVPEEISRTGRLHPEDAKSNFDRLTEDLHFLDNNLKSMTTDAEFLRDNFFEQSPELLEIIQHFRHRWVRLSDMLLPHNERHRQTTSFSESALHSSHSTTLETRLIETNQHFRFLTEVTEWIISMQRNLKDDYYGTDLPSAQTELEKQRNEIKGIVKFQTSIDKCVQAKENFRGEELRAYSEQLNSVGKLYTDLLKAAKKRCSDLETLIDFIKSATNELLWLNEKEEREITRDWGSKNLKLDDVEQYSQVLLRDFERRQIQFNSVQDRGESLLLQHHPASKCIDMYLSTMQTQWSWLLHLVSCLEVHLKHARTYQQYFQIIRTCDESISRKLTLLNSTFSKSDFDLDEGEFLLKDMQDMREELTKFRAALEDLGLQCTEIVPFKQRKAAITKPIAITAICSYSQNNFLIGKDETCVLLDNSQKVLWKVRNSSGQEGLVPGACFLIPPPDKDSIDELEKLRALYDKVVNLWQEKQLKMRQNMIFATIKVVKSWDAHQYLSMGIDQRIAIQKALNEDGEKLLLENNSDDAAMDKLQQEIEDVNKLFNEFEKTTSVGGSTSEDELLPQLAGLQAELDNLEHVLVNRVNYAIPRNIESLETAVVEHKSFELKLQSHEFRLQTIQNASRATPQESLVIQEKLTSAVNSWERIWSLSHLYVERLKCVEIVLSSLDETTSKISELELKLASAENIKSQESHLNWVSQDLRSVQEMIDDAQARIVQLVEDAKNTRNVVEKSRGVNKKHSDVTQLTDHVQKLTGRWTDVCSQVNDRADLIRKATDIVCLYRPAYDGEMKLLEEIDKELKIPSLTGSGDPENRVLECTNIYQKLTDQAPVIEEINTVGTKLAKTAECYDSKLKSFLASMAGVQPSLDGNRIKKTKLQPASEAIYQELDALNGKYELLLDNLNVLRQHPKISQKNVPVQYSTGQKGHPAELKSHVLNIATESDRDSPRYGEQHLDFADGDTNRSKKPAPMKMNMEIGNETNNTNNHKEKLPTELGHIEAPKQKSSGAVNGNKLTPAPQIELKNSNGSTLESKNVLKVSPQTSPDTSASKSTNDSQKTMQTEEKPRLLDEIIKDKCIDLKSGVITLPVGRSRSKSVPLKDAIAEGIVQIPISTSKTGASLSDLLDQNVVSFDNSSSGVNVKDKFSGEYMSVSESIKYGLLNPDVKEIFDSSSNSRITVQEALNRKVIDPKSGVWMGNSQTHSPRRLSLPLDEAREQKLIMKPLSLKDCCEMNLILDTSTLPGEVILDPVTQNPQTILESIASGLLDIDNKTVTDSQVGKAVSLQEALLTELVSSDGQVRDTKTNDLLPIKAAASRGLLSSVKRTNIFTIPCVIHPKTKEYVSLTQAVQIGLINPDNQTVQIDDNESLSVVEPNAKEIFSPQVYPTLISPSGFSQNGEELPVIHAILSKQILPTGEAWDSQSGVYRPMDHVVASGSLSPEKASYLKGLYNINLTTTSITKTVRHVITVQSEEVMPLSHQPHVQIEELDETVCATLVDKVNGLFAKPGPDETPSIAQMIEAKSTQLPVKAGLSTPDGRRKSETKDLPQLKRELQHVPIQGWKLREAIDQNLFDPASGLLTVPGTDRLVSFKECVDLQIIDSKSAEVIDSKNGRRISLSRSLEKEVLNTLGQYNQGEGQKSMTMEQAITAGLVILMPETTETGNENSNVSSTLDDMIPFRTAQSANEVPLVQVSENFTFNPNSATIIDLKTNEEIDLLTAVMTGKVEPRKVKIKDTSAGGKEININEAIRKGIVDKKKGVVKFRSGPAMSLKDALQFGVLSVIAAPVVAVKHLLERESPAKDNNYDSTMTARKTSNSSIEPITETILSEEIIPIETSTTTTTLTTTTVIITKISRTRVRPLELVDAGIIDMKTAQVLSNQENFKGPYGRTLTLEQAIEAGKISGEGGSILDPQTQELININEALLRNIVDNEGNILLPVARSISIPELKSQGLYDPKEQKVIHPETGGSLTIREAIASDVLNPLSPVQHPVTKRRLSLAEAVDQNVICNDTGNLVNPNGTNDLPLLDAINSGAYGDCIHPLQNKIPAAAITLSAAIKRGLVDLQKKTIQNPCTEEVTQFDDAISSGKMSSLPSRTEQLTEGKLKGDDDVLDSALKMENGGESTQEIITPVSSMIVPTQTKTTRRQASTEEVPEKKKGSELEHPYIVINPSERNAHTDTSKSGEDHPSHKVVPKSEEVQSPKLNEDEKVTLMKEYKKPYPLPVAIALDNYNPETGLFKKSDTGESITLQDAIRLKEVDEHANTYRDPRTGDILSLVQAIGAGLILAKTGQAVDPRTGAEQSLDEAVKSGLLLPPKRRMSLPEAIYSGSYDQNTNTVPTESGNLSLKDAISTGYISVEGTTLVKSFANEVVVPFNSAVEQEWVDLDKGTVKTSAQEKLNLKPALESGWLVEIKQPMSLSEIVMKGLYQPQTGLFLNPNNGEFVTLSNALEKNIIDSDSVHVKDTRDGFLKKMPLEMAIESGFISGETGAVKSFDQKTDVSLVDAMNSSIIVDSRMPISLQKALHLGLYSELTGRFTDPNTGNDVTLNEAIRRLIINPELPCVWSEQKSTILSLVETCRRSIIDRQEGVFHVPGATASSPMLLTKALERGHIIDIERPFSLYQALKIGLYDKKTGKFVHPSTGKRLTLEDACKEELIDPERSIVKHSLNSNVMKLPTAVKEGLIDHSRGVYVTPKKNNAALLLDEARKMGLILTTERPLSLVKAVNEHLYNPDTGRIVDTLTGDNLTVDRAISADVIDPKITAIQNLDSKKIKSLVAAIDDGTINVEKGTVCNETFDNAVKNRSIVTVEKPITFDDAINQDLIDFKRGTFYDPRTAITNPLVDAVLHELIEASSAAVRDPATQSFRPLREAQQAGLIDINKRALIDPTTGKLKTLCIVFEQGTIIYHQEPISFDVACDRGHLNLLNGQFFDPSMLETPISLKEAFDINSVDPNSVVMKDILNKRIVRLPDGYELKLVEANNSNVRNTATNQIVPLNIALDIGLVFTPRSPLGLISALDFSLYNSRTGKFAYPFSHNQPEITLEECLSSGFIESTSCMVKVPSSEAIVTLSSAIRDNVIYPKEGVLVDAKTNSKMNLYEAWERGYLLPVDARKTAVEEYLKCTAAMDLLLEWLKSTELRLACEAPVKENIIEIQEQIAGLEKVRESIDEHSRSFGAYNTQARQLIAAGGSALAAEELRTLADSCNEISNRFDQISNQCEKLLRHLTAILDEFKKYESEAGIFSGWLEATDQVLTDWENSPKTSGLENMHEFLSDIISHKGELRFITTSAEKCLGESKEFLEILSEFRNIISEPLPPLESSATQIQATISEFTRKYQEICDRANAISDLSSNFESQRKAYELSLKNANDWFSAITPRVEKIVLEPIISDKLEDQVNAARICQMDMVGHARIIDNVEEMGHKLLQEDSKDLLSPSEKKSIEKEIDGVKNKYKELVDTVDSKVASMDSESKRVRDIQNQLEDALKWLNQMENNARIALKPASLVRSRLDEQLEEIAALQAEISSNAVNMKSLEVALSEKPSKNVEQKLRPCLQKYEDLTGKTAAQATNFDVISNKLNYFHAACAELEQWMDGTAKPKPQEISQKQQVFDIIQSEGIAFANRKDVTDTACIKDKLEDIQNRWDALNVSEDTTDATHAKAEQVAAFENLHSKIVDWIRSMENNLENLDQFPSNRLSLDGRKNDLNALQDKYTDFVDSIDAINDLGSTGDIPLDESVPSIKEKLDGLNNRYYNIGSELTSRKTELDGCIGRAQKLKSDLNALTEFLNTEESMLPKDSSPSNRDNSDKLIKTFKSILEDMYAKQGLLDNVNATADQLLPGITNFCESKELKESLDDVNKRWKSLQDICKERSAAVENLREFYDLFDKLDSWLNTKDKMLAVLGPVVSDPRAVQYQLDQVHVIQDEFKVQQSVMDSFARSGETMMAQISDSSPQYLEIKEHLENIKQKWNNILQKLADREKLLNDVLGVSTDFYYNLSKIQENLHKVSDDLDELGMDKDNLGLEELRQRLTTTGTQLQSDSKAFAEIENDGSRLSKLVGDPASVGDVQQKLSQASRLLNRCHRKFDDLEAELQNSKKDFIEFNNACSGILEWLHSLHALVMEKLLVSADTAILNQQFNDFQPLYLEAMNKEHEIIMASNKGKELIKGKCVDKSGLQILEKTLDDVQTNWEYIKKETIDRQTRLQTCLELGQNLNIISQNFNPWLSETESKLDNVKLRSLTRSEVELIVKELNDIKNDILRHTSTFDSTMAQGTAFLSACDKDKEGTQKELDNMKNRWNALTSKSLQIAEELEKTSTNLNKFIDSVRDVKNSLSSCEDRLQGVFGNFKDARIIPKIKAISEDAQKMESPIKVIQTQSENLGQIADQLNCDSQDIGQEVDDVLQRFSSLKQSLSDIGRDVDEAQKEISQFTTEVKDVEENVIELAKGLNNMQPIARSTDIVKSQVAEIKAFLVDLDSKKVDTDKVIDRGEELKAKGMSLDPVEIDERIERVKNTLSNLYIRSKQRDENLDEMLDKLIQLNKLRRETNDEILNILKNDPIKISEGDLGSLKKQQLQLEEFKVQPLGALAKRVDECCGIGNGLVQSAESNAVTSELENDLEQLNSDWNKLKDNILEKERKLDTVLLQSGKYLEALDGLNKWLNDIEDMVSNQKLPSADFKVVKAQLQEQKFLNKMIFDRQDSVTSILALGKDLSKMKSGEESGEEQVMQLCNRYEDLRATAEARYKALEDTMQVATLFQQRHGHLSDWLDKMRKRLKEMSLIPTEEEKIQSKIKERDVLHNTILAEQPQFNEFADIAASLMEFVGDEEATIVADNLQSITDRYANLVDHSDATDNLLKQAQIALRHLVLSYEDLVKWMNETNKALGKHKTLLIHSKESLLEQADGLAILTDDIRQHENQVDETVESGIELMKSISNDEAVQLKDRLDSLHSQFEEVTSTATILHKNIQAALPLVTQFHECHDNLSGWMDDAEDILQTMESSNFDIQEIQIVELNNEIGEKRKILETISLVGRQLCQISKGDEAAAIDALVTKDNRRFEAICEQIKRRSENLSVSKQRSAELLADIEDLLDSFRAIEGKIKDADQPSCEPEIARIQLQEQRALNNELVSQKGRIRDVLSACKKALREASQGEDTSSLHEKAEDLKETADSVLKLSSSRLNALEQAIPLGEHFAETSLSLNHWMDGMEDEISTFQVPSVSSAQIISLQETTQALIRSTSEHKPLVEKLNKTGAALCNLCNEEDTAKVEEIMNLDNERYNALRAHLRDYKHSLEAALQGTSQLKDRVDGLSSGLENISDQLNNFDPISALPEKIREQIQENETVVDDVRKWDEALNAVSAMMNEVMDNDPNKNQPSVGDVKQKLSRIYLLRDKIQKAIKIRGENLEKALILAESFWAESQATMDEIEGLQDTLDGQEAAGVEPKIIQNQQKNLESIKKFLDELAPSVAHSRQSGESLIRICNEQDHPDIKKNIHELDSMWNNITSGIAKRDANLNNSLTKSVEFHDAQNGLVAFLTSAEKTMSGFGLIGDDLDAVKKQIVELSNFKLTVDPNLIKLEALNRRAVELTDGKSHSQTAKIKGPLADINRRFEDLLKRIVERQRELESGLLHLGQFQHALNELVAWTDKTNKTINSLKPVRGGDPQFLEVELAKFKVIVADIQSHQNSVDALNTAGRHLLEFEKDTDVISKTQQQLGDLNKKWVDLEQKSSQRQQELENALADARNFSSEIQDLLFWLNEIDAALLPSKPVGGLLETATEQLESFKDLHNELEANRPKVETNLRRGQEYVSKSADNTVTNLQHNLKLLGQRWESVMNRANDKKVKLEIALKEATDFHTLIQDFINWLTEAEMYVKVLEPTSRVMDKVVEQVETHKEFQKKVNLQREVIVNLEKKGNHLKYFSQKQDLILIKNLLVSVQHRWDGIVSKSGERTRSLDIGFKEAKEFHDMWSNLCTWLDNSEPNLDEQILSAGSNSAKIKQMLVKHKEFQRALGAKQPVFDSTIRVGKTLKDKAPKNDEPTLRQMLTELKTKWSTVCGKTVDRQRNLEDTLVKSGHLTDALSEIMDWLKQVEGLVTDDVRVRGDLDTVLGLIDQHKKIEDQLRKRELQLQDIYENAAEILETSPEAERESLANQLDFIKSSFDKLRVRSENKAKQLDLALVEAEQLHASVNALLEWLSDAEMRLRFAGSLPEDEHSTTLFMDEQNRFMQDLQTKEAEKDNTVGLAKAILANAHPDAEHLIKHWISVIKSRWDEISSWAKQRDQKLHAHLTSLGQMKELLEDLVTWLQKREEELVTLEAEPLSDDLNLIQELIKDHKEFTEGLASRQADIDSVCKPKLSERQSVAKTKSRGQTRMYGISTDQSFETSADLELVQRKLSKAGDPQIKNPRVKFLWDKWKQSWMMTWERQRRLQDKYTYLMELEKVKNFSWDDWRKPFLKFMNHKKSRVTDLFRRIDRNNNGMIPRELFIDAIMKSKFPTSRLEMNAVSDMFDRGDQMIDYVEFIAALRPDWEERKPPVDTDVVDDEIQRAVMKCTCRQQFRVFQIGDGKYRFGDSQKLRLVRILRSTVMVRVGGGWVALDEFLVKNDPCRAKGRTNIELREQFILADGVSQTMSAFKTRAAGSTASSGNRSVKSLPAGGPAMKGTERSIRSTSIGRGRPGTKTPDSLCSDDGFVSRLPRKSLGTPGRGGPYVHSGSHSKPPSRAGSTASLNSSDDGRGSRIPVRRSTSFKQTSSGPGTLRTPNTPAQAISSRSHTTRTPQTRIPVPSVGQRSHSFTETPIARTPSSSSITSGRGTGQSRRRPEEIRSTSTAKATAIPAPETSLPTASSEVTPGPSPSPLEPSNPSSK